MSNNTSLSNRLVSIDVLRAIVLLGILIVHTVERFGFAFEMDKFVLTQIDSSILKFSSIFLSGKCAKIFCFLFGISFYLISSKVSYTHRNFIVRCLILIGFGLFNKLFYTYDTLLTYGICGLFLIPIKDLSVKKLFILFCLFTSLIFFMYNIHLGDKIFPNSVNTRYISDLTLLEIIQYQPYSVIDYLKIIFNGGIMSVYSIFVLGYLVAKNGVNKLVNIKLREVIMALLMTVATYLFFTLVVKGSELDIPYFKVFFSLSLSLSYIALFFYCYRLLAKVNLTKYIDFLAYYGRMGLTNYSLQGIIGVCYFYYFSPTVTYSILTMLLLFACQTYLSYLYLRHHKQGPMEWVWRKLINALSK